MTTTSHLLELATQLQDVLYHIEMSNGLLTPELEARLGYLETQFKEKPDAYKYVLDKCANNLEYWENLKLEVETKIAQQKNIRNRLIRNMNAVMDYLKVEEIVGNIFRFKRMKTAGQIVVDDLDKLPAEFKVVKQEVVPDKDKIRKALKDGEVPGARLQEGTTIKSYLGEKV